MTGKRLYRSNCSVILFIIYIYIYIYIYIHVEYLKPSCNFSRYTSALGRSIDGVTTVANTHHGFQGHGYGELTITSTNLEAALAEADHTRVGEIDGAIAAVENSATGRTSGTVSIMVMYRPQKSPKVPLAAAELPPSYDSLFVDKNPPNYSRIVTTVNLPTQSNHGSTDTTSLNNDTTETVDIISQPIPSRLSSTSAQNANEASLEGITHGSGTLPNGCINSTTETSANIASTSVTNLAAQSNTTTRLPETDASNGTDKTASNSNDNDSTPVWSTTNSNDCEDVANNDESKILQPSNARTKSIPSVNLSQITNNEDHCQCDCDHTNCNNAVN